MSHCFTTTPEGIKNGGGTAYTTGVVYYSNNVAVADLNAYVPDLMRRQQEG